MKQYMVVWERLAVEKAGSNPTLVKFNFYSLEPLAGAPRISLPKNAGDWQRNTPETADEVSSAGRGRRCTGAEMIKVESLGSFPSTIKPLDHYLSPSIPKETFVVPANNGSMKENIIFECQWFSPLSLLLTCTTLSTKDS
jgi:hypothetical protein